MDLESEEKTRCEQVTTRGDMIWVRVGYYYLLNCTVFTVSTSTPSGCRTVVTTEFPTYLNNSPSWLGSHDSAHKKRKEKKPPGRAFETLVYISP